MSDKMENNRTVYGNNIIATLSQQLGYTNYQIATGEAVSYHFVDVNKTIYLIYNMRQRIKSFFGGIGI